MTDEYGNSEEGQEDRMVSIGRKDLKRIQEQAKEGKKATAENEQLKRKIAFAEAGVPTSSKLGELFVRGYDGDATPDAIRDAWSELNGNGGQSQPSPADAELAAMQSGQDLASGGMGIPPDKLAERNQKLAGLSPTDRFYDQKFAAIMDEYGSPMGSLAG